MSAPAHVLVLRPIIERLRAEGHEVEITSRDYAQTQQLLELHGMEHTPIGRHGGASRLPEANMHDYEYAVTQHRIGCRLARRVMFPDTVPLDRLRRFGVSEEKYFPYPGLKEEYYLYDFEPDPEALVRLGVERERVVVIVRPPPDVSLYHRKSNPLFPKVLDRLGRDEGVHAVVLPRTA